MKKSPIIKKIPVSKADAILLKVPYEGTVSGGKGAAGGPRAIVEMLEYQVEMFDYLLKKTVCDEIGIIQKEVGAGNLKPEKLVEKVQRETLKFFGNEKFLVMLGGEHTVSLGAISAAKKIFGNLTVIQIDAHADMRNDNSDYEDDRKKITKHAHSCVMRRAWELGCDIVPVGIRSLSPMEHEFIGKEKLEKNIFYSHSYYRNFKSTECNHFIEQIGNSGSTDYNPIYKDVDKTILKAIDELKTVSSPKTIYIGKIREILINAN